MTYPDSLPGILFWKVGATSRTALPRKAIEYLGSSGRTNQHDVCPQIPVGATAWQLATDTHWRPMTTLPKAWLPFLNRERGTALDPRPKQMVIVPKDAFVDELP